MAREVEVIIRDFEVTPFTSRVSKGKDDQCKWINKAKTNARVVFTNGSPFQQSSFDVPSGGEARSGPPRQGHEGKKYVYDVVVAGSPGGGGATPAVIDPEVIVER